MVGSIPALCTIIFLIIKFYKMKNKPLFSTAAIDYAACETLANEIDVVIDITKQALADTTVKNVHPLFADVFQNLIGTRLLLQARSNQIKKSL